MIRELFRPWREASTWWALTHLLLDVFMGTVTFTSTVVLLALSFGLLITFPLAVPFIWALFVCARVASAVERSRIAALLGERIDDGVPPLVARSPWARLVERVKSRARWKGIAYDVLALPRGVLTTTVTVVVWCGSAALLLLPLYVSRLPGDV
ncbi:MAG TPA: sensor domain-containing protein, partial [Acidimicrobiales bacterium]|nr:sensor domain-containing protein [Acidimicrobiales bacterium]